MVVATMTYRQALRVVGKRTLFRVVLDSDEDSDGGWISFDVKGPDGSSIYGLRLPEGHPVDGGAFTVEAVLRIVYHDASGPYPRRVQYILAAVRP